MQRFDWDLHFVHLWQSWIYKCGFSKDAHHYVPSRCIFLLKGQNLQHKACVKDLTYLNTCLSLPTSNFSWKLRILSFGEGLPSNFHSLSANFQERYFWPRPEKWWHSSYQGKGGGQCPLDTAIYHTLNEGLPSNFHSYPIIVSQFSGETILMQPRKVVTLILSREWGRAMYQNLSAIYQILSAIYQKRHAA